MYRSSLSTMLVKPGVSVGPFKIGMPIREVIKLIQERSMEIDTVDLKYNEEFLLATDILIDLLDAGILLRIEPLSQRLKSVEVYELSRVELKYHNRVFSGRNTYASFGAIHETFGPTVPGVYDEAQRVYTLNYAGLSFEFLIPAMWSHLYENTEKVTLKFPDGQKPCATRMMVYDGVHGPAGLPPIKMAAASNYFEPVRIDLARCTAVFEARGGGSCSIGLGYSTQAVVNFLGRPSDVFTKEEYKIGMHSLNASAGDFEDAPDLYDYFYNYFELGIDFLFDGRKHTVKKMIFHTNCPTCAIFNVYAKCNFRLVLPSSEEGVEEDDFGLGKIINELKEEGAAAAEAKPRPDAGEGGGAPAGPVSEVPEEGPVDPAGKETADHHGEDYLVFGEEEVTIDRKNGGAGKGKEPELVLGEGIITANMKWDEIKDMFVELPGEPLRNIREKEDGFGPTRFFGYEHLIFEIMDNGHIASVSLF